MRWITLRQLKALKKIPVPPAVLENGRRRLLIVMADAPMAVGSRFRAYVWKPALAAFVVVVFVAVSGGSVVYASQGALPGDALYAVKLASEDVHEHLTISPERKFAVQAEHAAMRLEETQELLLRDGLDPLQREKRVRKAMDDYEQSLTGMSKTAARLVAAPRKRGKDQGLKAVQAAERVLDRHAELVASATDADPEVVESVIAPIDGSIKLEDDVFAFTHLHRTSDGGDTEDATGPERQWDEHRKQRGEELSDHLKRLRAGLHQKPLEIKAGM